MKARSCLGKRGGRSSAGAQYASGVREPEGLEAGWEKTRHKIGCRWAGLGACEKRKPSTKGKLGLESVIWVISS